MMRCLADSNRCRWCCRPLPSRSAKAPFFKVCKYIYFFSLKANLKLNFYIKITETKVFQYIKFQKHLYKTHHKQTNVCTNIYYCSNPIIVYDYLRRLYFKYLPVHLQAFYIIFIKSFFNTFF